LYFRDEFAVLPEIVSPGTALSAPTGTETPGFYPLTGQRRDSRMPSIEDPLFPRKLGVELKKQSLFFVNQGLAMKKSMSH
jgi:hypothetical protein